MFLNDFKKHFSPLKLLAPPRVTRTSEPISSIPSKPSSQSQVQQALQELIKKEEYKGCSAFENGRRSTALYVCIKEMKDGANKSHLYYYDRIKSNKFSRVTHLSVSKQRNPFKTVTMYFEKESSQVLGFPPPWARLWKKDTFTPESDCKVETSGKSSYLLSCDKLVNQTIHT